MRRVSPVVYLVAFLSAFGLIFVGQRFALPFLTGVGVAVFGLAGLAVGIDAIAHRHFDIPLDESGASTSARYVFRGLGGVFWGLLFVTLGLALLALAGVLILGLGSATEQLVLDRPGIVLAPLGFAFLCIACGWLYGEETMNSSFLMVLLTLPQRLGAAITLLFSLALLALGVFELVAPESFDQIVASLRPPPFPDLPDELSRRP